jgi:hypothetical protein
MSLPGQSLVESSTVMAASRTALAVRIKNVLMYYLFLAVLEISACAGVARSGMCAACMGKGGGRNGAA